jgi:hypothetical protein
MSFAQTLMHYKLGHHPMGGKFFRNHINFHHTYYSKDHPLRTPRDLPPGASECVRRRYLVEQASIPFATPLVNSPRHPMFL